MEPRFNNRNVNSQPPPNHSGSLLAEQIKLAYQQAPKALFVTLVVAAALTLIFWDLIGKGWLLGWRQFIPSLSQDFCWSEPIFEKTHPLPNQ